MENLKAFFSGNFCQTFGFEDLDWILANIKKSPDDRYCIGLITELHQIIQSKSFALAEKIMIEDGRRSFDDLEKTEKFIKFLYDKLTYKPTDVKATDFANKAIVCPACCPDFEKALSLSFIHEATVIGKNMQIYICKPCKLVWLTEDIQANNAQDYKKFMKSLGLNGSWKELKNVKIF